MTAPTMTAHTMSVANKLIHETEVELQHLFGKVAKVSFVLMEDTEEMNKKILTQFITAITGMCCTEFHITPGEVKSDSRERDVVDARKMIAKLIKDFYPKAPLRVIGLELGGRCHATVINLIERFGEHYVTDIDWKKTYNKLFQQAQIEDKIIKDEHYQNKK